ncbi:hydroxymethylglutaryl-CoA lyase [Bradyrhizobium canariense]|uniref:Hydroxymethylglutaryl-CoA lyase n=1 Tax=Bradyrhizobium canariense TaxID=255045 RepID=A0A1H1T7H2_9BRAD|nr:hydroxymethylglutaryl-CoA lyase [Bradyrhizobium canariense]SDS56195.1 hydroxymethylglutaryl-CoA lyase [Bradyrhizobium canariense]
MAERIHIREVGPRDGLQLVATMLTAEQKIEWCGRARDAGIEEVEVTSFVPPSVVPQFADAGEVARGAVALGGFVAAALVPNLKGAQRAIEAGLSKVNYVLSASEAHNLANVRRTTQQSIDNFKDIIDYRNDLAKDPSKRRVVIAGGIATSFGCTISGDVDETRVLKIAAQYLEIGADELIVADTVGYGNPAQVRRLMSAILREAGSAPVACHFHDTYGLGLANVTAAIDAGVRAFDSAVGGLGGCPFAPGASGNINTEDTIYLVESLGFETGIDIAALLELRRVIESWLPGERFTGTVAKAGLPKTFRRILNDDRQQPRQATT